MPALDQSVTAALGTPSGGPLAGYRSAMGAEQAALRAREKDPEIATAREAQTQAYDEYQKKVEKAEDVFRTVEPYQPAPQRDQYMTNPVEALGSVAGMFGLLAAGFTRQPAKNALSALGAVLKAQHEADDDAYVSAYEAWQDSSTLMLERHKMMTDDLRSAMELARTKPEMANAKLKAISTKYDDQLLRAAAEKGDWIELGKMQDARDRLAMEHQRLGAEFARINLAREAAMREKQDWARENKLREDLASTDPARVEQAKRELSAIAQSKAASMGYGPEARPFRGAGADGTPEGGRGALAASARAIQERNPGMPFDRALDQAREDQTRAAKLGGSEVLSAAQLGTIRSNFQMYSNSLDSIERAQDILRKYPGAASKVGIVLKTGESLGNALGISNETDRHMFEREIAALRADYGPLSRQARGVGRATAQDKEFASKIIQAGRWGDTNLSAYDTLEQLKKVYLGDVKMLDEEYARGSGWRRSLLEDPGVEAAEPVGGWTPPAHDRRR